MADASFIAVTHDTGNVTTYTIAGVSIGVAHADRYVIVAATWASSNTTVRTISGTPTIGGINASVHAQTGAISGSALGSAILIAAVPTGTTATISITLSGGGGSLDVGVYRVVGLASATPFDTAIASDAAGGGIVSTSTLDVPHRGLVIACANFEANSGSVTWVGASGNYDESNGDGSPEIVTGAMSNDLAAETNRTVSATHTTNGDSTNDCCMSVASWAVLTPSLPVFRPPTRFFTRSI